MSLSGKSRPNILRAFPVYFANIILLVLSTQTLGFLAVDGVHAIFFLAPLFYWTIHKPSIMPLWFVFLSGLAIDFAVDSLLGLHAFGFLVFYILLFKIRRIVLTQPMFYHVMIFAFAVFIFELVRWLLVCILEWQLFSVYPSITGFVVNLIAFMPILLVLKSLHRLMSGSR